jgi:phasin family protein
METIENVTATTQTAFTDATDRAKGAVDKSQKLLQEASEFGKGNIEALVESSKIAARGLETLGQDAAAYAKKSFEEATTVAKTLTSVKSPTEFFKLHSDYVRSSFDALVQHNSHNAEAVLKLAGEVVQPLSNRVALAAEKLKVAA